MPTFRVTSPDGAVYEVKAPEGATEDQAIAYAQQQHQAAQPTSPEAPEKPASNTPPVFGMMGGTAANFAQGALLGGGDEAIAGAAALMRAADSGGHFSDLSNYYDEALPVTRQGMTQFSEEHPYIAGGAGFAGGAATIVPSIMMGGIPAETSLLAKMGAGAKAGAGIGALSGFNNGEGGFGNRAMGSAKDAAFYAGLSAALPLAMTGGANFAKGAWNVGKDIGSGVADIVSAWTNPEKTALAKIGQAIAYDATPVNGQAQMPVQDLINTIKQRGLSPAEAGGANLEAMTDALAQKPGTARPFLQQIMDQRVAEQRDKITGLVQDTLGSDGQGTNAIEMAKAAKEKIAPLAEAAFQPNAEVNAAIGADPLIQRLLGNEDVQAGIPRGIRIIRNEADAANAPFNLQDYGLANQGANGEIAGTGAPNMRMIDAAKRGLDAQISENSNEWGHLNDLGRSQFLLKKSLVSRAKELHPAYAEYLNTAADQFALRDAAKLGRGIWNTPDKEETITRLSDLSAPEKKVALDGAVRSLTEHIERRPDDANLALTKLGRPYYRDLLAPLVDDPQSLDNLVTQLQQHADAFRRNSKWLKGSQTALRQAYTDAQSPDLEKQSFLQLIKSKLMDTNAVRDHATNILLNTNPEVAAQNVQRALQMMPEVQPTNFIANPALPKPPALDYRKILSAFYAGSGGNSNQGK